MAKREAASLNRLLHLIGLKLRFDRLGIWSKKIQGLSLMDLHILQLASDRKDLILMDIRKALDIPHSTLTSAINRLEKRGLLRRAITQRDRRSYRLELTKKGKQVQTEHHRVDIMLADKLLEALDTDKEREQLIRLLTKISQGLNSLTMRTLNKEFR